MESGMKQSPDTEPSSGAAVAVTLLVLGISLNTLGVVLVALRGIGWPGFLLMLAGIGILLYSVYQLTVDARRGHADERSAARSKRGQGGDTSGNDTASPTERGTEGRDG
jgi:hypothetical protein